MGKIIVKEYTTKEPLTMIGTLAGVCWNGKDTPEANYKRGIECLKSEHGRTFEFPDVYLVIDGYSARVMREYYTHIGGSPTRLQESTRYVDYSNLECIIPHSIDTEEKSKAFRDAINQIKTSAKILSTLGVPKEDIANLYPLGMKSKMIDKRNLRNFIEMSHQRECKRAYWEFREMFEDIKEALRNYSPEWTCIVDNYFMPKCKYWGKCKEKNGCIKEMTISPINPNTISATTLEFKGDEYILSTLEGQL